MILSFVDTEMGPYTRRLPVNDTFGGTGHGARAGLE